MASGGTVHQLVVVRRQYLRPLWLGIMLAVTGELFIFLVFGMLLNGPGSWSAKLVWTVGV